MNAADVLEKAADVIVERGWCRDAAHGWNGEVCVVSAVHVAANDERMPILTALDAFGEFLIRNGRPENETLGRWNASQPDASAVLVSLRSCAASLRAAS